MPGIRGPTPRREARSRAFSLGQNTERGRPARKNKCGQDARAPQSNRPQLRHSEKPRKRGLRFAMGSTPRPGVKRRASRPPTAEKARQRAFASGDTM